MAETVLGVKARRRPELLASLELTAEENEWLASLENAGDT